MIYNSNRITGEENSSQARLPEKHGQIYYQQQTAQQGNHQQWFPAKPKQMQQEARELITLWVSVAKYETINFIKKWQWLAAITP